MSRNWFRSALARLRLHTPGPPHSRPRPASVPENTRVYAIGDIHGRLDLLTQLLDRLAEDAASYDGDKLAVFLGDYIDRGPDSKGVIDRLMQPLPAGIRPVYLQGNHEWAMLQFFTSLETGAGWMQHGGMETLKSYGIPMEPGAPTPERLAVLQKTLRERFPRRHRAWLESCPTWFELGDYHFVHAGIRPGTPLDQQTERDRLWIRQGFLDWRGGGLEKMIVHGHTISPQVEIHPHRIGIDTGAYASGCLTAIVLEGTNCRIIQTSA